MIRNDLLMDTAPGKFGGFHYITDYTHYNLDCKTDCKINFPDLITFPGSIHTKYYSMMISIVTDSQESW